MVLQFIHGNRQNCSDKKNLQHLLIGTVKVNRFAYRQGECAPLCLEAQVEQRNANNISCGFYISPILIPDLTYKLGSTDRKRKYKKYENTAN
jgi:hypothetical protein